MNDTQKPLDINKQNQGTAYATRSTRVESKDSLDDFPTPTWAVRGFLREHFGPDRLVETVLEPAVNRGFLAKALHEKFSHVHASDIHDYGYPNTIISSFLEPEFPEFEPDWIITNPPFNVGLDFILKSLTVAKEGCAFLVRQAFLETHKRYEKLYSVNPPDYVYQYVERVPMAKGRMSPETKTASSYCWLVWDKNAPKTDTVLKWIAPCRKELERPEDYVTDF